jgi:hypothetical protein
VAGVVLGCKAVVAVLLAAAGGAKLADLRGFAASVRLFLPGRGAARSLAIATALAGGEVAVGAASLSSPRAGWLNLVVLVICAGFVAVSAAGYARHPGRPCRCFGALTGRGFSVAGIGRAAVIALGAAAAAVPVRTALVQVGPASRLGLLAGALLVAAAAYSAAAAVAAGDRGAAGSRPRWA